MMGGRWWEAGGVGEVQQAEEAVEAVEAVRAGGGRVGERSTS